MALVIKKEATPGELIKTRDGSKARGIASEASINDKVSDVNNDVIMSMNDITTTY